MEHNCFELPKQLKHRFLLDEKNFALGSKKKHWRFSWVFYGFLLVKALLEDPTKTQHICCWGWAGALISRNELGSRQKKKTWKKQLKRLQLSHIFYFFLYL